MPRKTQVYISNISRRTHPDDLRDFFRKCGKIRDVDVKNGYAFIDFEDSDGAEAAVEDMDGKRFEGEKLIVEYAKEKRSRGGTGPQEDDVCYNCGEKGHWANECRKTPERGSKKRGKKCYNCGSYDHIKRYCPESSRSSSRSSYSSSRSRSKSRKHKKSKKTKKARSPSSSSSRSRSESSRRKRSASKSDSRSRSRSRDRSKEKRKGSPDEKRKSPENEKRKSPENEKKKDSPEESKANGKQENGAEETKEAQ